MVFTVFSAYPAFAATLGLYIFFSKTTSYFSLMFGTFFHQKSMKKWSQEPIHKKIDFFMIFIYFLSILGPLGDPRGAHFFEKNVKAR